MKERPTYGYKRITAMINRNSQNKYNKKRIYRLMRINDLTFPKNGIVRANKQHTGKIMTLHSNTRWCSDAFVIRGTHDWTRIICLILDLAF